MPKTATPAGVARGNIGNQTELQDWFIVADAGDLTLKIANGLRVGEDRWGELTLNHPLSAHRWLEFTIDADGSLWCRSNRKDIGIRCDDKLLEQVQLDTGVPIQLPHNLLHISHNISRGRSSTWQLDIGLLDNSEESAQFDQLVDTQTQTSRVADPTPKPAPTKDSIPTLESVAPVPRPHSSSNAGPAIERAVAKLKQRTQSMPAVPASARVDSVEAALVPVAAHSPFHTDEIRAALEEPIAVRESIHEYDPLTTPALTTVVAEQPPLAKSHKTPVLGMTVGLVFVIAVALLAANLVATDLDTTNLRSTPAAKQTDVSPVAAKPAAASQEATETTSEIATVAPTSADDNSTERTTERTTALVQTAATLLADIDRLDTQTLDFAIRSLNLVLASEPDNVSALAQLDQALRLQRQRTQPAAPASVSVDTPVAASPVDPRLTRAKQQLAAGAIVAPRDGSAVAYILSVLADDPAHTGAINLLNESADRLVAQADREYVDEGVYAARNTLEEVLSFHPRHGPANERWQAWVAE